MGHTSLSGPHAPWQDLLCLECPVSLVGTLPDALRCGPLLRSPPLPGGAQKMLCRLSPFPTSFSASPIQLPLGEVPRRYTPASPLALLPPLAGPPPHMTLCAHRRDFSYLHLSSFTVYHGGAGPLLGGHAVGSPTLPLSSAHLSETWSHSLPKWASLDT